MQNKSKLLSDHLREQLAPDGRFGGVDAVARKIGEKPTTLWTWLRRNKFPDRALSKLQTVGVLAESPADLQKSFSFELARKRARSEESILETKNVSDVRSLEEVFSLLDNHAERLKFGQGDFDQIVGALYRALGERDHFVYVSYNEIPIEWLSVGWETLSDYICPAVKKGAVLTYVTGKTGPESFAAAELTVPNFAQAYERFVHWISAKCAKPIDQVRNQVRHCPRETSPFFLPHSKLALFRSDKVRQYRGFISIPKGASVWLSLPLDEALTNSLAAWLKHADCLSA